MTIMQAIYIILMSVAAALVCSMIRPQRPEIATAVSLAVGLGALLLTGNTFSDAARSIQSYAALANINSSGMQTMLKAAGLTILCELGVQICCDAGESALAGRIRLACRLVMLGMAMPILTEIVASAQLLFA